MMKKINILLFAVIVILFSTSCKKFEILTKTIYSGTEVSDITYTHATISTEILEVGENLKTYGYCYGTMSHPTINTNKIEYSGKNAIPGKFSETINGLVPDTKYYVRVFSDGIDMICSNEQSFRTEHLPIGTYDVTNIAYTTANCGGSIPDKINDLVTTKGVCWSENPNPTITDNKIEQGSGAGTFSCDIENLSANTIYYIRAFATISTITVYGTEIMFSTAPYTITDYDSNTYNTILIGDQIWMQEDLRVTHYPNGASIPNITNDTYWGNLENNNTDDAYCFYNNDDGTDYGALYTWSAAMGDNAVSSNSIPSEVQGICPNGWHIPSSGEWMELHQYLGGEGIAGGKIKEAGTIHWQYPNEGATNSSHFTALPGGFRLPAGFYNLKTQSRIWSSTESENNEYAELTTTSYISEAATINGANKSTGASVRCIRD